MEVGNVLEGHIHSWDGVLDGRSPGLILGAALLPNERQRLLQDTNRILETRLQ